MRDLDQRGMSKEDVVAKYDSSTDNKRITVITFHNTMSYQIDGITFDENPTTITFNHRDKKDPSKSLGEITMQKYFEVHWKVNL